MQYYGTLGPACGQVVILEKMFEAGMTGVRMNMSHGNLDENGHWLELLFEAAEQYWDGRERKMTSEDDATYEKKGTSGAFGWSCAAGVTRKPQVLIDLRGPELRLGRLENEFTVVEGELVPMGENALPVPQMLLDYAVTGDHVLLDDGKLEFIVESVIAGDEMIDMAVPEDGLWAEALENRAQKMPQMAVSNGDRYAEDFIWQCKEQGAMRPVKFITTRVLRGGTVKSGKSLAIVGKELPMPTLTESDLKNIGMAAEYGVTGVMQPFVRNKEDLLTVREALRAAGAEHIEIFAKIENLQGVAALEELLPYCDHVVIARGDLGNAMPLWELPRVQKEIAAKCRAAKKPFMVVTQMLDSMHERAVPTRAEVSDIYNAVLDGAASVMLTGETAAGKYPVESMEYLVKTGEEAVKQNHKHK